MVRDEIPGADWDYGTNLSYLKTLVEYWRTRFNWKSQEKLLNTFSHYQATVDGLGIHFVHARGQGPNPMP
jgi:microsomal epoxide hydrolase